MHVTVHRVCHCRARARRADCEQGMSVRKEREEDIMSHIWVVIADAAGAHVFAFDPQQPALEPLFALEHPQGRLKASELESDRPGSAAVDASSNRISHRNTGDGSVGHELDRFAARIAERLDEGRHDGSYDGLVLVMPPRLLGRVRAHLSKETSRRVKSTVDRRLDVHDAALTAHLRALPV